MPLFSELVSVTNLTLTEPCLRNGSTVSFRCGVAGFPRPDIEFLRNGFVIITPQQKQFENFLWKYYNEVCKNCLRVKLNINALIG